MLIAGELLSLCRGQESGEVNSSSAEVTPGISGMSCGPRTTLPVNGLGTSVAKGGLLSICLKIWQHRVTFDVLIMSAGCGTAVRRM